MKPFSGWIDASSCGASGSDYHAQAVARKGSSLLRVEDPGDFRIGQQVTVSNCNPHYYGTVYSEKEPYYARNQKPLGGELEIRGLRPGQAWRTFLIHFTAGGGFGWLAVDPAFQTKATHHPILKRHWEWNGEAGSIPRGWIPLADGVEVRFHKRDWKAGQCVAFHARNRLVATITGIRGRTLRLDRPAAADAEGAVVRHLDQLALQRAVDRAIAERKSLFIPAGRYRLDAGLWIRNATLDVEGANPDLVTLDVSEAHTAAFWIAGGQRVAVRNLGMVGHTGFLELPANVDFMTASGHPFYPCANQQMEVKGCAAANIVGTESLLFEDLKVSRMASEAFYLHGSDRYGVPPFLQAPHADMPELGRQYTKSCVFHRCHVSDCGFNVFNNNDYAENTEILHCRVERAANFCESPSRFTRIIGNYVKDGCSTSVHLGARPEQAPGFRKLAGAQAIIADNVFEGGILSGGVAIGRTASQVTIAHNLFVGFSKETAICVWGGDHVVIAGNQIDLTAVEGNPDRQRCGIDIETSGVIVSGNHIFAEGPRADKAAGINVARHAAAVTVHDNVIENCGDGLVAGARVYVPGPGGGSFQFRDTTFRVSEVTGPAAFRFEGWPSASDAAGQSPGWVLTWRSGPHRGRSVRVLSLSPDGTLLLAGRRKPREGDAFTLHPLRAQWQVHHNTIRNCGNPLKGRPPGKTAFSRLAGNQVA